MKKIIVFIVLACMALFFIGCDNEKIVQSNGYRKHIISSATVWPSPGTPEYERMKEALRQLGWI